MPKGVLYCERKCSCHHEGALVAYSAADYRFEQAFPVPECGPDDIIIKTEGCGICAGDLKCQHGAAMFWGRRSQPSWVEPPLFPAMSF